MVNAGIEAARILLLQKQMQNILFLTISYSVYLALAFFQTPQTMPDLNILKDVGMGSAFIGACFWMFRYFTSYIKEREQLHRAQLAEKDAAYQDLIKQFIEISNKNIAIQTSNQETDRQVLTLLQSLNAKL